MCLYCQELHKPVNILSNAVSVFEQSVNKSNFDKSKKTKEHDELESRKDNLIEEIELHRSAQRPKRELDKGGANELSMNIKETQLLDDAEEELNKIDITLDRCLTLIDRHNGEI